ncbi:hypothetical protein [Streptomyces hydrogenans]|uniref:hypothetical protein n=1 Tax=Streptomyces hydrogenans TaxID=1873719 RepID=UPI0037FF6163
MTRRSASSVPTSPGVGRRASGRSGAGPSRRAGTVLRLSGEFGKAPTAESHGAGGPANGPIGPENGELLRRTRRILAEAGYEPGNGLTATADGPDILVSWHPDSLIRPLIAAHATDPDVHRAAEIPGLRAATATALTTVFLEAGLTPLPHPDGTLRIVAGP